MGKSGNRQMCSGSAPAVRGTQYLSPQGQVHFPVADSPGGWQVCTYTTAVSMTMWPFGSSVFLAITWVPIW